jgi:hypothetical protein
MCVESYVWVGGNQKNFNLVVQMRHPGFTV